MSYFWLHEIANSSTLVYWASYIFLLPVWFLKVFESMNSALVFPHLLIFQSLGKICLDYLLSREFCPFCDYERMNITVIPTSGGFLLSDWWCKLIHHTYQNISTVFKDPTSSGYVLCIFDQDKWLARCLL